MAVFCKVRFYRLTITTVDSLVTLDVDIAMNVCSLGKIRESKEDANHNVVQTEIATPKK